MINTIQSGDCLKLMDQLEMGTVDLAVVDPPFNIGYKYDVYKDQLPDKKYAGFTEDWIYCCFNLLKPNGSLYVIIGDEQAALAKTLLDKSKLKFRNWIIWHYTFGQYCESKFSRCHCHILYYTKGDKSTWNPDSIRVQSKRQQMGDKRANPKGKVPSDVWDFSRVCGTFKERREHSCQLPEKLVDRIIKVSSNEGDLVLDPMCGSGTVPIVAKRLNRNYIGFDISEDYCKKVRFLLEGKNEV